MRVAAALVVPIVFLAAALDAPVGGQDWPRFRGPNGSGVAEVAGLPRELNAGAAAWRADTVPGHSSPIVVGDLVVLTGSDGDQLVTVAYDAQSGQQRWRHAVTRLREEQRSPLGGGPAVATPVSDGERVVAFFPEFGLLALDLVGGERWRRELPRFDIHYSMASSPIIEGGVVILLCDQLRGSYLLGVDAATGAERWRSARQTPAESWTTPVVRRAGRDDAEVLVFGTAFVDAYAPRTGERRWRVGGFGFTPVASPVLDGDRLFVVVPDQAADFQMPTVEGTMALDGDRDGKLTPAEMTTHAFAGDFRWLDVDGDGALTRDEYAARFAGMDSSDYGLVAIDLAASPPRVLWREQRALPYIATPIVYRGALFTVRDGGILTSFDPGSGAITKRGRIEGAVEPFFPSPVAAGGRLYLTSNDGTVATVSGNGEWQVEALADLGEETFASPAIGAERLFIRTKAHLYAWAGGAAHAK